MRTMWIVAALAFAASDGLPTAVAQDKRIDLSTKDGVAAVKGQWKYHDVKVVEVEGKGPDGKPNKTYNIDPPGRPGIPARLRRQPVGGHRARGHQGSTGRRTGGLLLLVPDQGHHPARGRGQGRLLPDDR